MYKLYYSSTYTSEEFITSKENPDIDNFKSEIVSFVKNKFGSNPSFLNGDSNKSFICNHVGLVEGIYITKKLKIYKKKMLIDRGYLYNGKKYEALDLGRFILFKNEDNVSNMMNLTASDSLLIEKMKKESSKNSIEICIMKTANNKLQKIAKTYEDRIKELECHELNNREYLQQNNELSNQLHILVDEKIKLKQRLKDHEDRIKELECHEKDNEKYSQQIVELSNQLDLSAGEKTKLEQLIKDKNKRIKELEYHEEDNKVYNQQIVELSSQLDLSSTKLEQLVKDQEERIKELEYHEEDNKAYNQQNKELLEKLSISSNEKTKLEFIIENNNDFIQILYNKNDELLRQKIELETIIKNRDLLITEMSKDSSETIDLKQKTVELKKELFHNQKEWEAKMKMEKLAYQKVLDRNVELEITIENLIKEIESNKCLSELQNENYALRSQLEETNLHLNDIEKKGICSQNKITEIAEQSVLMMSDLFNKSKSALRAEEKINTLNNFFTFICDNARVLEHLDGFMKQMNNYLLHVEDFLTRQDSRVRENFNLEKFRQLFDKYTNDALEAKIPKEIQMDK